MRKNPENSQSERGSEDEKVKEVMNLFAEIEEIENSRVDDPELTNEKLREQGELIALKNKRIKEIVKESMPDWNI